MSKSDEKKIEEYLEFKEKQMQQSKLLDSFENLNDELASTYEVMKNVMYYDYYFKNIMTKEEVKQVLGQRESEFKEEIATYNCLSQSMLITLLNCHVELYYYLTISLVERLEKLSKNKPLELVVCNKLNISVIAAITDGSYESLLNTVAKDLYQYLHCAYSAAIDQPSMFRVMDTYLSEGITLEQASAVLNMESTESLQLIDMMKNNDINLLSKLLEVQQSKINLLFEAVKVVCHFILSDEKKSCIGITYRKCITRDHQLIIEAIECVDEMLDNLHSN